MFLWFDVEQQYDADKDRNESPQNAQLLLIARPYVAFINARSTSGLKWKHQFYPVSLGASFIRAAAFAALFSYAF